MNTQQKKIAYAGIYSATAPRDKVYIDELKRRGYDFVECVGTGNGLKKYMGLYRSLKSLQDIDLVWVGYLSPLAVVVAYFATRKKIVYNALCSSYESYVLDRAMYPKYSLRALFLWVSDFFAFHLANVSLVESESQKQFISRVFFVNKNTLRVVYTGADESIFHPDASVKKAGVFTVAFRGMFAPATGVLVVLEAAKLLKNEAIRFWISGWGQLQDEVLRYIVTNKLENVELNTVFLDSDLLRQKLLSAHVLLGQFSKNSRLDRTIQHKTIEALALGMPYITRDSVSNRELLIDNKNALFVRPADPEDIARKILILRDNVKLREGLGSRARQTFLLKCQRDVLVQAVLKVL